MPTCVRCKKSSMLGFGWMKIKDDQNFCPGCKMVIEKIVNDSFNPLITATNNKTDYKQKRLLFAKTAEELEKNAAREGINKDLLQTLVAEKMADSGYSITDILN